MRRRAFALAVAARSFAMARRAIDSHIHVWTPEVSGFPRAPGAPAIPAHLEKPGTAEEMHKAMTEAGVSGALIVQPVNYGQDYSYVEEAARQFPGFFKGMCVADPSATDPVAAFKDVVNAKPSFWVGVRFNPNLWANVGASMADDSGQALFAAAGDLGLPVGFMPFQGLAQHVEAIERLLTSSPTTQVIIDHWGFFLQPPLGFGERTINEESFANLLRLGREYPQVHVKLSAMFRTSQEALPFADLEPRFVQLLGVFTAKRLLWGSDAPYFLDFGGYGDALALEKWPTWEQLDPADRADILHGNAERLFGAWGSKPDEL